MEHMLRKFGKACTTPHEVLTTENVQARHMNHLRARKRRRASVSPPLANLSVASPRTRQRITIGAPGTACHGNINESPRTLKAYGQIYREFDILIQGHPPSTQPLPLLAAAATSRDVAAGSGSDPVPDSAVDSLAHDDEVPISKDNSRISPTPSSYQDQSVPNAPGMQLEERSASAARGLDGIKPDEQPEQELHCIRDAKAKASSAAGQCVYPVEACGSVETLQHGAAQDPAVPSCKRRDWPTSIEQGPPLREVAPSLSTPTIGPGLSAQLGSSEGSLDA
ncbi:hypothetical protein ACKKBF_B33315 [Auxenochlorella protothecoides x Auxenochlorella symbiontica]